MNNSSELENKISILSSEVDRLNRSIRDSRQEAEAWRSKCTQLEQKMNLEIESAISKFKAENETLKQKLVETDLELIKSNQKLSGDEKSVYSALNREIAFLRERLFIYEKQGPKPIVNERVVEKIISQVVEKRIEVPVIVERIIERPVEIIKYVVKGGEEKLDLDEDDKEMIRQGTSTIFKKKGLKKKQKL